MTELHFIVNSTAAVTETIYDGKPYLIAPVVAIREGVLNDILYLSTDIAQHAGSWSGHVIPIGHPKRNGEYVSANSRDIWANEVVGNFWDVAMDGDRLKGDIWIDLEKAEKIGEPALDVVEKLRAGEPIEVSTGVLVDLEETAGIWNEKSYIAIARNIFPDHLALLPNEIGACSWDDGCGTPRVNQKGASMTDEVKVNELTLDDRASLVRRAFWEGIASDPMSDPYELDVISIFDAVVIAKDWSKKAHIAYNYTLDEAGNVTIGAPTAVDVVYRAKEGGAEVVIANKDGKQRGILTRLGQWLGRDKTDGEGIAVLQQEEKDVKKCDLVATLVANKQVKVERAVLETWDEAVLQAFHDTLIANSEEATPPVTEPVAVPAEWQKAFADLAAKVDAVLGTITANADQEKSGLVADLVANEQCQFDDGELKAMSVNSLRKLASSLQMRDYSGGAGFVPNNSRTQDEVMLMPKPVWAVAKEAK